MPSSPPQGIRKGAGGFGLFSGLPHTIFFFFCFIGVIKLKNNGDFFIANEGRRPIYIDGRPVLCGSKWRLSNNSVVEVSGEGGRGHSGTCLGCGEPLCGPGFQSHLCPQPPLSPAYRLPACDSSSSSTRTSLPLSGLRLPRSPHSEVWWRDPWALWPQFPLPFQLPT